MAEKRSLFDRIFGRRPKPTQVQSLRMLNQYNPIFTMLNDAYDSDVVRAAVDAIARNAAKLKPKHIRRVNGTVTPTNSNTEYLLSVRPNPYMDGYSFLYKVVTQLYMQNNSYIFIDWEDNGQVKALYPVNANQVEFVEVQGEVFVKFSFMAGQQITLPYKEIIHLRRFFYKSDFYGDDSVRALIPTLELINTTNEGLVNAVKSSASLRGLLKFSAMMKPDDMKKQRDMFVTDYLDISNNGGVAATDSKAEYVPLNSDPKMIDAKQMELIEDKVFKYFNVNASIVKSDYSEQQWNAFYESVIEPIAIQLSLEFTSKVFTEREQGWGNEIIFEANRLQYASVPTKVSLVNTLMPMGLLTLNEAREIFNLSSVEDGDKRLMSLNYVDANIASQYQLGKTGQNESTTITDEGSDDNGNQSE